MTHYSPSTNLTTVAVIGAGLMGHGIAQLFATGKFEVRLYDIDPQTLSRRVQDIAANLETIAAHGLIQESEIEQITNRVHPVTSLNDAVAETQLVIEAIPEDVDLKRRLFRDLDELCAPSVILATNTSVISISDISSTARARHRIVGTHFWNPPYLMPLVEVVAGKDTSQEVVDVVCDILKSIGKRPIKVRRDVPGFIGNRLQHALWREAISIVESGIADPEDVDEVVSSGFGLRLPVLGPLKNADLVGLDLTFAIHDYLLPHICSTPTPSQLLLQKVNAGESGCDAGRGFYAWTPEEKEEAKNALLSHLMTTKEVRSSFTLS